jgi:hypothetical protein
VPDAYRGTAAILEPGTDVTGGREGVVRVTPLVSLADGDAVSWGMDGGYGAFVLHGWPDLDAHLYRDGLRAFEARLAAPMAADGRTYPGLPVRNQEAHVVAGLSSGGGSGGGSTTLLDFSAQTPNSNFRADLQAGTAHVHTVAPGGSL